MISQQSITFNTSGHRDMHDLTHHVKEIIHQSGVQNGLVHLFNLGSTGMVGTIEFEPGLERDLPEWLDKVIPPGREYGHEKTWHDGNSHSHLQASLIGASLIVPINNGEPVLGQFQQIFHLECDTKPRERTVVATVMGELFPTRAQA